MQGGRCISESFHNNILDLNQQSVLSASNVNHSTAWWGNLLNPGRQDTGKSTLAAQDQVYSDDLTLGKDWFAPTMASSTRDAVHRDQAEQSGIPSESGSNHGGNHVTRSVPNLSAPGPDNHPQNTVSRGAYMGSSDGCFHSASLDSYPSGRDTHERLAYDPSLNNHGASSRTSDYLINSDDKSGSSLVSLGKRKAPDDGHAQLYAGRSSSSHLQPEINFVQHTVPASANASGSITTAPSPTERTFIGQPEQLNLRNGIEKREIYSEGSRAQLPAGRSSTSPLPADNNMQHTGPTSQDALARITTVASPMEWSISQPEQLNLRIGIEERETYSEFFPPPNITDVGERLNVGQQEPNLFLFPFTDSAFGPSDSSSVNQPSRSFGFSGASLVINSSNPSIQSHEIRAPENTGGMLPSHRSGSLDPQSGRLLKSLRVSGGISTTFRDAQNSRNSLRNHSDFSASDTTTVSRRLLHDTPALNLASGTTLPSQSLLPSSRSGSDLSIQNHRTGWTPPQDFTGPNQQGVIRLPPQVPFHPNIHNYRSQRGYSPVIPPTPSSLTEGMIPSFSSQGRQNRSSRSALLIGEHTDPTSGQHGLALDIEARQRLVRQVRNTMQRGVNRRAQNFAIGVADLHDRHRDMRLDIDNMSYEELLALEDRIGNVCTGLSDEVIMRSMKRRKHLPMGSSSSSVPCCICQDEFVAGDDIGATVCEHEFHFKCIKQWLSLKNTCPICKKTALDT